jgi:hypothetical protein
MELADAFTGINGELRDLLRDSAAKADKDAQALGEIEAGRLAAEGRMGEIEAVLKEKVDSGELPSVRLPAAQRGASLRVGHEHAEVGLQTYLLSKKSEIVAGAVSVDDVVKEGFDKFGAVIGPDAFYERLGFEKASQEVITQFRHRVTQEQTIEAKRFQDEKRANEGVELAFQLGTASDEIAPVAKSLVKMHLDALRMEMPKSEVNAFFSKNILAPAVARLIEGKNFDGAAQLLEEIKGLDLTGKGGLYGKTAEGSETLLQLQDLLARKQRVAGSADADRLRDAAYTASQTGHLAAAEDIVATQNANGGNLPLSERLRLQDEARKNLSPLAYDTYAKVLNDAYENDERWRQDPQAGAKLLTGMDVLDPQQLDAKEAELELAFANKSIPASIYVEGKKTAARNRALAGSITDTDVEGFQKLVFEVKDPITRGVTIGFSEEPLLAVWDRMDENQRTALRVSSADYFVENFRQQVRLLSGGVPENVPGIKAQAFDKASTLAREFTKSALTKTASERVKVEAAAREKAQAQAIRLAKAKDALTGSPFKLQTDATTNAIDFRGAKTALSEKGNFSEEALKLRAKDMPLPKAEKDFVSVAFRSKGFYFLFPSLSDYRLVYMPALAEEAIAKPQSESAQIYAVAKSTAGFTPEEIKAGKTKHGVLFNPSQIDPKLISVFRSVSELNKHWNNGEFDETFASVGDAVDSQDSMTPQQFYLAQVALLSK